MIRDTLAITDFTPEVTIISATEEMPAIDIFTPTIVLDIAFTSEQIEGLDTRTLGLYSRDSVEEEWERVPSAVYPEQNKVKGELTTLTTLNRPIRAAWRTHHEPLTRPEQPRRK